MGPHSGNVGDQLVLESAKELIRRETDVDSFLEYHRRTDITSVLDKVNSTNAVILPAFEIRSGIVPYYRFCDDITNIEVPIIPMGAGWSSFPGDYMDVCHHQYGEQAMYYLNHISQQVDRFTTRDIFTSEVLRRNGISDTELVGDCAWYDPNSFGESMARPTSIEKVVFTTPHSSLYRDQAENVLTMLREEFPDAELFCSLHNTPSGQDRALVESAESLGYEIKRASLNTENIEFYANCDLHVGYRLHGHIAFLRKRVPSVLINEDGRGAGLTHTLGGGGFDGFRRRLSPTTAANLKLIGGSKYARWLQTILDTTYTAEEWANSVIAPADGTVPEAIRSFVQSEIETGFESYSGIGSFIDTTYKEHMKPFLNSLPE